MGRKLFNKYWNEKLAGGLLVDRRDDGAREGDRAVIADGYTDSREDVPEDLKNDQEWAISYIHPPNTQGGETMYNLTTPNDPYFFFENVPESAIVETMSI